MGIINDGGIAMENQSASGAFWMEQAQEVLDNIRGGRSTPLYPDGVDHMVKELKNFVSLGKGDLSDLGITEEELSELRIQLGKKVAALWLEYMRDPENGYDLGLYWMNVTLEHFGLSLADIGTTEAELDQLHSKHALERGRNWMQSFQTGGTGSFELFWDEVGPYFERGDFSLADMGTTEEEFDRIKSGRCLESAKLFLEWLRTDKMCYKVTDRIYRLSRLGGFSLAHIGTSGDELESLRPRENRLRFG